MTTPNSALEQHYYSMMNNDPHALIEEFLRLLPKEKCTFEPMHQIEVYQLQLHNDSYELYCKYIEEPSRNTLAACIIKSQFWDSAHIKNVRLQLAQYVLDGLPDESPYL
jgi:hypothetical protein